MQDSRCCFLEPLGFSLFFLESLANERQLERLGNGKPQPVGKPELHARPERNTLLVIFVLIVLLTLAIGMAELWNNMH